MLRTITVSCVVVTLLVACGSDDSGGGSGGGGGGAGSYSTDPQSGIATFYDADGSGNCSFDATPNDLDVVALNYPEYAESAACGECIEVKGPKGTVTVRVVDSCPGCEKGHLDLSEQAFVKIADKKDGRVSITYRAVGCSVSGNLKYHFKDGSSKYWTAIQVRNHRVPVSKLEYKKGGAYVAMKRESYNYFVESEGVGDQPEGLVVRVTSADGQTVEDTLPGDIKGDSESDGSGQFR